MERRHCSSHRLVLLLATTVVGTSLMFDSGEQFGRGPSLTSTCSDMKAGHVDCSHRGLTRVPTNIPKSVRFLDLSHNRLSTVAIDAFDGLTKLERLDLSYNTISRKSIVMDLFKDLGNLQELYLNYNQVNSYQENTFSNLGKLRVLDLSDMNNGIPKQMQAATFEPLKSLVDLRMNNDRLHSFKFLQGGTLHNLRRLELARNDIPNIAKEDFSYLNGTSIDNLDLSQNQLGQIDPACFRGIGLLNFLNLEQSLQDESVIPQVGAALQGVHVTNLTLALVGLSNLSADTFKSFEGVTLKALDLSLNNVSKVEDAPFRYLNELTSLNLYKNDISLVGPHGFDNLANLKTLNLANNSLTVLNQTSFQSLKMSVLETMHLELNAIETIESGAFDGLGQLMFLKLSMNKIKQELAGPEFKGMPKLEYLDLALNTQISLGDDAFESITALRKLYLNVIGLKTMTAGKSPFRHLVALQTLDLSNNSLSSILSPEVFKSLSNLQVLYLQHNNLYHLWEDPAKPSVPFLEDLTSLQKADLSYNGFHLIPDGTFKSTPKLQTLLLAHNLIGNFSSSSFEGLSSLVKLELQYNNLNVLHESDFRPFLDSLQSLSVSGNPWMCNCELEWFRKWINDTDVAITDLGKTFCTDPRGMLLLEYWPSPYDCDGFLRPMYYYIIGGTSGFILAIILVLWCCRWRIRYCLLRGRARRRYTQLPSGKDTGHEFDAFISYSSNDADWVKNVLIPELTNREDGHEHFRINDHDDSFIPGDSILNNIEVAVDRSRKTLCILSRNFLGSEWCRHEHEVAMFRHLGDKKCLIVIRLDDVTDQEVKQHDRIHQVMRQDTYLDWPGDETSTVQKNVFWERLRAAIAKIEEQQCSCCCC